MFAGERFGADGDAATAAAMAAIRDEAEELRRQKVAKKAVFDEEYDIGECMNACMELTFHTSIASICSAYVHQQYCCRPYHAHCMIKYRRWGTCLA